MNLGVYVTAVLGSVIAMAYIHFYGYKNPYFGHAVPLYTLGSILSSYSFRLNVDPQLDFNFNTMVYAEAASFTGNTLIQAALIRLFGIDPILSFGLANFGSGVILVVVFKILALRHPHYTSSLWPKPLTSVKGYLLPNTLKFSLSLAYNALLNDFFDQTYFVVFASSATYLGEFNLIRGFGSLFIRFIYMPINNVTYNLYSKLYSDAMKADSKAKTEAELKKIAAIVKMVVFLYANLTYFLLFYGAHTSKVFLSLMFGSKWVTPVS
jgi:Rft protein